MLKSAAAALQQQYQEDVPIVREGAEQLLRLFYDSFRIAQEFLPVEIALAIDGNFVGDSIHLEFYHIVIAHENRRVYQIIVISKSECFRFSAYLRKTSGNLAPPSRELNLQFARLILKPIHVEKYGSAVQVASGVIQKAGPY